MKVLLSLLLLGLPFPGSGQLRDLSRPQAAPERKAVLDGLRKAIQKEVGVPVSFVVEVLRVDGSWAFFRGRTRNAAGGAINWSAVPAYRDAARAGLFDGDGTAALLHRKGAGWVVAAQAIGPTDVAWACWWKEYGAPRRVFDLAEDCR